MRNSYFIKDKLANEDHIKNTNFGFQKEKLTVGAATFANFGGQKRSHDLNTEPNLNTCNSQSLIENQKNQKLPGSLYRNAKPQIKNFFQNLSSENDNTEKMSFGMLMSNFRRKKIIDTLKNKDISYTEKQEIL